MEEEKKVYTIADIAKELGVSTTTVSRAISGKGRISESTRERVKSFIARHDYHPNVLAKGLAQSKTYNLGLLMPEDYTMTEFPFFKDCMSGICEVASACNYDVIVSLTKENDLSHLQRLVTNRKADGIILSRSLISDESCRYLREKDVPFVVIGHSEDPDILSVDNRNREAAKDLTGLLIMKGVKKLMLLGGDDSYMVTEDRLAGFRDAHQLYELPVSENLIFLGADNRIRVMRAVEFAIAAGVEGIIGMDDFITNLALGCLREKGIRIPEDVRLASMYDSSQLEYNIPPVTSLRFDTKELGRSACRKLLGELGEKMDEGSLLPMSYQVVMRESTM
ncbi:MAG: LacI family transcriptional regulator [Clostridiales bacterium]|nr:LacI family transcriptional regulator [Clostridiales bacterium]